MRCLLLAVLAFAPLGVFAEETAAPGAPAPVAPAAPAAQPADWGWAFLGALEMGGDEVAKVYYTDGSSQNVHTGQGGTLAIGVRYRPTADSPVGLRSTFGYKFVSSQAEDADIGIDRWVWDLVASYRVGEDTWVGGGFVRHTGTKFEAGGFGPNLEFDDALGLRLELGWRWIALAYTNIDYTDQYGNDYDASSLGVVLTNAF